MEVLEKIESEPQLRELQRGGEDSSSKKVINTISPPTKARSPYIQFRYLKMRLLRLYPPPSPQIVPLPLQPAQSHFLHIQSPRAQTPLPHPSRPLHVQSQCHRMRPQLHVPHNLLKPIPSVLHFHMCRTRSPQPAP